MNAGLDLSSFANMDVWCDACSRQHKVPIRTIVSGAGAVDRLGELLKGFEGKNVYLVGDHHTLPLAEGKVTAALDQAGCKVEKRLFDQNEHYILNEELIGAALIRMPSDTDLIIAVGSGTMNDLCRVLSARCRIPYIVIGTAPSMDGYASMTSAVVMDGMKRSVVLGTPIGIIADPELMRTAPAHMLASGVADILGKHVAIADWQLSHRETGEVYCPEIAKLITQAVARIEAQYKAVLSRDASAIRDVADTLILSGVAIAMNGNSRPASGSEHQLAHHWEAVFANQPGDSPLHGNLVGFGTVAALRMYQIARSEYGMDLGENLPAPEAIDAILKEMGGWSDPRKLGISQELFRESFYHGVNLNGRYTLLTHLDKMGKLDEVVDRLTEEYIK